MTSLAFITNLAGPQGWIILLIVVLLFGAKKLPELGRSIGQTMREFQKSKEEDEAEAAERTRLAQEKTKQP